MSNRIKQVNTMFDLLNRECHKTLNSAKNARKGAFSSDIRENYELFMNEVLEVIEAYDEGDMEQVAREIPDVVNFCAALLYAIKTTPASVEEKVKLEAVDWCR
jgi:NTP pyrophosphatase (non-canonical NTP hydrolase)